MKHGGRPKWSPAVIAARHLRYPRTPLHPGLERCESLASGTQRIELLAEREPDQGLSHRRLGVEARPGHARDADILGEPVRELGVVAIAELREIRQDVIRTLGHREREPGLRQRRDEDVAPRAVVDG